MLQTLDVYRLCSIYMYMHREPIATVTNAQMPKYPSVQHTGWSYILKFPKPITQMPQCPNALVPKCPITQLPNT